MLARVGRRNQDAGETSCFNRLLSCRVPSFGWPAGQGRQTGGLRAACARNLAHPRPAPQSPRQALTVTTDTEGTEPRGKRLTAAVSSSQSGRKGARVSGHRTGCHDSGLRPYGTGRKPASGAGTDTGFHVALCSFVGIDRSFCGPRTRPSRRKSSAMRCDAGGPYDRGLPPREPSRPPPP